MGTAGSVAVSFEWRASGGYYTPIAAGVKNSVGTFSVDLTGLTPGITYYYRAKADGDGNPVYGTETSFTASVIPPAVTFSDATNVTSTSARLNANLVSLGTKTSVTVSFLWRLTGGTYTETLSQAMTAGGAVWADLNDLTQGATYYCKVKVVGAGDPAYSDEKSFTTADSAVGAGDPAYSDEKGSTTADTAAPAISVVSTSDITVPSATVTWTTNEPATSQVEYGLTEEYGSLTTLDTNLVKSHSVDLTGLKAGKTYHYRVISKDASNNQAVLEDATFTTSTGNSSKMPFWPWLLIGLVGAAQVGGAVYFERAETVQDTLVRRLDEAVRRVNLLERENNEATVKAQSLEEEVNKLRNLISLAESVADEMLKGEPVPDVSEEQAAPNVPVASAPASVCRV
jgi:hypothetical protein